MIVEGASKIARRTRVNNRKKFNSYVELSRSTSIPTSILWHRANERLLRRENVAN